jgi:hypothetical protein
MMIKDEFKWKMSKHLNKLMKTEHIIDFASMRSIMSRRSFLNYTYTEADSLKMNILNRNIYL